MSSPLGNQDAPRAGPELPKPMYDGGMIRTVFKY